MYLQIKHVTGFCCENNAQKDISETAGTWSLIWSMGRIPEQIISALVETKEGMTRPGQSQRQRPGSTYRVCEENATETVMFSADRMNDLNLNWEDQRVVMYLKVLSVPRSGWNRNLFIPKNSVYGGTLSHIRISNLLNSHRINITIN